MSLPVTNTVRMDCSWTCRNRYKNPDAYQSRSCLPGPQTVSSFLVRVGISNVSSRIDRSSGPWHIARATERKACVRGGLADSLLEFIVVGVRNAVARHHPRKSLPHRKMKCPLALNHPQHAEKMASVRISLLQCFATGFDNSCEEAASFPGRLTNAQEQLSRPQLLHHNFQA